MRRHRLPLGRSFPPPQLRKLLSRLNRQHGARDAAVRAKDAADRAKTMATKASEASQLAATRTEDEQAQADQTVVAADDAKSEARDRFHKAEKNGFPKDRP